MTFRDRSPGASPIDEPELAPARVRTRYRGDVDVVNEGPREQIAELARIHREDPNVIEVELDPQSREARE